MKDATSETRGVQENSPITTKTNPCLGGMVRSSSKPAPLDSIFRCRNSAISANPLPVNITLATPESHKNSSQTTEILPRYPETRQDSQARHHLSTSGKSSTKPGNNYFTSRSTWYLGTSAPTPCNGDHYQMVMVPLAIYWGAEIPP